MEEPLGDGVMEEHQVFGDESLKGISEPHPLIFISLCFPAATK
jgi:hypothetical protein